MSEQDVLQVVWDWRGRDLPAPTGHAKQRRKQAAIEFCVMLTVAALFRFAFHKTGISNVILCVASIVLIGGLFIPKLYAGFKRLGAFLAKVLGTGVTWLLLVPFFYIFFTIARVCCVIGKKDPMCQRFAPEVKSYWVEHPGPPDAAQYRKQY